MTEEEANSLTIARRADARCDEFEHAFAVGLPRSIESFLVGLNADDRKTLLIELMGIEVDIRRSRHGRPVISDYLTRFPELSVEQIADILENAQLGEDALVGRKLHIYQCVSLVGAGAMGRVYLALHDDLQRHCALKVLSPRRGTCDAEYVARFLHEGQAAASLIHPNIVTLHAVGQMAGTHFLEMEYIPGRSLQQLIREEGPLPADRALRLTTMVADGLAAAHRAGIVHRDVKPDNVMVTSTGIAKIGDFGLAKRLLPTGGSSLDNVICGTPNYMAPELFQGKDASPASDVYALGLCLFQMLIGKLPWHEASLAQLARSGRKESVPDIRDLRPELSLELAECVTLLTAPNPNDRPVDAVAASVLLHAVLGSERDLESLLIEAFSNDPSVTWVCHGEKYCVTRRLPGNRQHQVFLEATQHAANERILLLYAICCRATPSFYEQALLQNAVVLHGSLAIREIDGHKMFVMINAYPRSTVAPEEIRRSVLEIASHADQVEHHLTGQDHN
ncbi:MAG: serine/threonine-protein kinase [Planctomycetia bacterium]|nr:serine/threonine-protein kinase [Planctomycetia bacterium]